MTNEFEGVAFVGRRVPSAEADNDASPIILDDLTPGVRRAKIRAAAAAEIARLIGCPVDGVSSAHSLAEIGVDSMVALKLERRLLQVFSVSLPFVELLGGMTLDEVARAIDEAPSARLGASPSSPTESMPLSHAQRALWLHHASSPDSSVYNSSVAFRGRFDPSALRAALDSDPVQRGPQGSGRQGRGGRLQAGKLRGHAEL